MPPKIDERERQCRYDVRHIGELCQWIRESRGLQRSDMARACELDPTTIQHFEEWGAPRGVKTLNPYIEALHSSEIVRHPLKTKQELLRALHRASRERRKQGCKFSVVNFDFIKSQRRPKELNELVQVLRDEQRPAFVMDALWFIHAVNGALWRMFNITPQDSYLSNWEAWHTMATKFRTDSPVRRAHVNSDEYFPPTIVYFFEDARTYPFMFTFQMRQLIARLTTLSEEHGSEFHEWWPRALAFDLPYKLRSLTRTITYQGEPIQTEAVARIDRDVEMETGYPVTYTLAVWNPIGSDATGAFQELQRAPDSHTIYYATDYDKEKTFHINSWPAVAAAIDTWKCV